MYTYARIASDNTIANANLNARPCIHEVVVAAFAAGAADDASTDVDPYLKRRSNSSISSCCPL